jgi:hypothetical protein
LALEKIEPAAALPPARAALLRLANAIRAAEAERDAVAREYEPLAEPAQRMFGLIALSTAVRRHLERL